MHIILASASPRRQELLRQVGVSFHVIPSSVDERVSTPMAPCDLVKYLAVSKARDVANSYPDALVIGADTLVVVDGTVLGKPRDRSDAVAMLQQLSGREHEVMTGVAFVTTDRESVIHETTKVRFIELTQAQIDRYVDSGEPMDKAGAYAIQGKAGAMISGITGDYSNVVGLPVCRTLQLLSDFGVAVL